MSEFDEFSSCYPDKRLAAQGAVAHPPAALLELPGHVLNRGREIAVRLDRKTYNPVLRQVDLPVTAVFATVSGNSLHSLT